MPLKNSSPKQTGGSNLPPHPTPHSDGSYTTPSGPGFFWTTPSGNKACVGNNLGTAGDVAKGAIEVQPPSAPGPSK